MLPEDQADSPVGSNPSWMIPAHERYLKPASQAKYKSALKEFQRFLMCKQLSRRYLPGHSEFELAPVEVLRRFAQHIAKRTSGKIKEQPRTPTICHKISMLVSAIEALTGMRHDEDIVSDVHAYVKYTLVKEGLVTTKGKRKFDFDGDDIRNTHLTLWTELDPNCNSARKVRSGRFQVFLSAVLYLFLVYGARISAILPKTLTEHTASIDELWAVLDESITAPQAAKRDRSTSFHSIVGDMITGLRYKDFVVLLIRKHPDTDEVEPVVTLAQRFFKNNENPREDALIAWGTMRQNFLRDYIPYVLAFAFADKAFQKFPDPASMMTYKMKKTLNCEECKWRDDVKDLHIFRESPDSDKPYSQFQWNSGLQMATKQAGYTDTITVHRIRQHTTQKVNATGISPAQHKHLFNQSIATFQKNYMNEHTSVDAQAIAFGEDARPDIADMLRSAKRGLCKGLPTVLTSSQRMDAFEQDLDLVKLEMQWQNSCDIHDQKTCDELYALIKSRRRRVCQERLRQEQSRYYASQTAALDDEKCSKVTISQQRCARLMSLRPQHARIAQTLAENHEPEVTERVSLLDDLVDLARETKPCASWCHSATQNHTKSSKVLISGKDEEYCYLCFCPIASKTMDSHLARTHLSRVPMDCGLFYYQSETKGGILNPGLCPFCLADESLPLQRRFHFFTKRREHMLHLSTHLDLVGEARCPHPTCATALGMRTLVDHLEAEHGIDELGHHLYTLKQHPKGKSTANVSLTEICPTSDLERTENLSVEDHRPIPTGTSDDEWMKEFLAFDFPSSFLSESSTETLLDPYVSFPSRDPTPAEPPLADVSTLDETWISYDAVQVPCRRKRPEANIGSIMKAKRMAVQKKDSGDGKVVCRKRGKSGGRRSKQVGVRRR